MRENRNRWQFGRGARAGLPIGIGYFAVSFSLGIIMRNAGLKPVEGLLMSLLNNTSAGEAAGVSVIANGGSLAELALGQLVINARYLLMGAALTVAFSPSLGVGHRLLVSMDITDETFAVTSAQERPVSPWFSYGMAASTIPMWAAGTTLGIIFGNILPADTVNALSVALYAMFVAVVAPPARRNAKIFAIVLVSMAASFVFATAPVLREISEGMRTIILTIAIAGAAAFIWPIHEEAEDGQE